jgi:chaperonin GroES
MSKIIHDASDFAKLGIRVNVRYAPRVDFVLIKRIDDETGISTGGIIIPESGQQKSNKGRVVAVGEGRWVGEKLISTGLSAGDVVVFSKYGAEDLELDGEMFLLMRADEIKLIEKTVVA